MIDAVDQAVMTVLQADSTLAGLAPGGVHRDVEPETIPAVRAVIVSLQSEQTTFEHGGPAYIQTRYQVKVIDPATTKTAAQAAANRIDELLNGAALTIAGQAYMTSHRVERFAYPERTAAGALWQHVGADYEVWSDPA